MALVVAGGVWAPFIIAVPSFLFNCFLSLAVFIRGQLQIKCFRAAAMVAAFLICLGVLLLLSASQTMNSSITPSIPSGSSLS